MACHKRTTFWFAILFSIAAFIFLCFEQFYPTMIKERDGSYYGPVFKCKTQSDTKYLAALVTSCISMGLMIITIIFGLALGFGLCCSSSTWPNFISRFVTFYIILDFVALGCNIAAMAIWTQKIGETKNEYRLSFYFGWAANLVMLILLILVTALKCCARRNGSKSGERQGDSMTSIQDQVLGLYRSLHGITESSELKRRSRH
ncbi:hypothetical protein Aperf_G00000016648 [Anoplocephala perfoliata]